VITARATICLVLVQKQKQAKSSFDHEFLARIWQQKIQITTTDACVLCVECVGDYRHCDSIGTSAECNQSDKSVVHAWYRHRHGNGRFRVDACQRFETKPFRGTEKSCRKFH